MHHTVLTGSCDLSPIWELTLSWTLGVEAWMAKLQIIYGHVATEQGYPRMLFLRVPELFVLHNKRPEHCITTGLCDLSPVWEVDFSGKAWTANNQPIYAWTCR